MDIMAENLDDHTPEEITQGAQEYFRYLEECDSQLFDNTWEALMKGSVILYDFSQDRQ
jgi:hypothetical protein